MGSDQWPQYQNSIPYSDESSLNTLDICLPRRTSPNDSKRVWVIYIHGGAWRDPMIDSASFTTTQKILLDSPISEHIAGYASLNYRLSPYPSHPESPSNPSDPARNARHPTHINDVLSALLYLQDTYHFNERYVLIGHSCGATLAFQVAMRRYWGAQYESTPALELNVEPPLAIVGAEGIFDVPALVKEHGSMYRDFVVNAFGEEGHGKWEAVSPSHWTAFEDSWTEGRLVVLAHSKGDSLVDEGQPQAMGEALKRQGWEIAQEGEHGSASENRLMTFDLIGDHDGVWQTGQLARAINCAVQEVAGML